MPISKDYRTLICRTEKGGVDVVMTYITDKEEDKLDKGLSFTMVRGDKKFKVDTYRTNVICYGKIDFTRNSDDYCQLEELIKFNNIVHIPIDYDLETHCCYSPIRRYRTCECSNIAEICHYNYGVLGKPEKVIIFKTTQHD